MTNEALAGRPTSSTRNISSSAKHSAANSVSANSPRRDEEERTAKRRTATTVPNFPLFISISICAGVSFAKERLGTRHFIRTRQRSSTQSFRDSGTSFRSSNILYWSFALSLTIFVRSVELVPRPTVELCFHLRWSKECQSMARTHRILVVYWTGSSRRSASLYRQLPAWATSGSRRTCSRYRVAHVVDAAPGSQ